MPEISLEMSAMDLLKLANDFHTGKLTLSAEEKSHLLDLLRIKGAEELEYGQEVEHEKVRLVRRVTGAVSIFFEKEAEPSAKKKAKE
ncbi:MAG TPA: hypothetical protein PKN86_02905 [Candidatus Obscuribacter sp.]|nr:hypothetical protein [Candidatus Melainabacteria bacterium]MBK8221296.1 hypothetical protein [Candidatus Obscuribacter sp.]MBK9279893.1 hypothetical protein [Candidatus Obscuribacter sp.]MBL8085836.1 hypothetical protein [Candidatus Obscuribacter sp.]MDX1987466.1 hypothetical protein [Candidatus Obscuribacter sp.]